MYVYNCVEKISLQLSNYRNFSEKCLTYELFAWLAVGLGRIAFFGTIEECVKFDQRGRSG